jgi:hypothetical protein
MLYAVLLTAVNNTVHATCSVAGILHVLFVLFFGNLFQPLLNGVLICTAAMPARNASTHACNQKLCMPLADITQHN